MKKKIASILLLSTLCFGSGVPTVDVAALTQMIRESLESMSRWGEQISQWKKEAEDTAKEYAAKTGIRDAVQIYKKGSDAYYEIIDAYDGLLDLGSSIIDFDFSEEAIALTKRTLGNDFCKYSDDYLNDLCWKANSSHSEILLTLDWEKNRIDKAGRELAELADKLSKSQDLKESADIAAAIELKKNVLEKDMKTVELKLNTTKQRQAELEKKYEKAIVEYAYKPEQFDYLKNIYKVEK